jgi:hypothetical protein
MKCSEFVKQFELYIDGSITGKQREDMDGHLKDCAVCRGQVGAYRESGHALACLKGEQALLGFADSVMARIKNGKSGKPSGLTGYRVAPNFRWKFMAVGFASAAIVLAITLPLAMKPSQAKLAIRIALASPDIQAAFGGIPMSTVTVQNVIMNDGQAVVVLRDGDRMMVVAGVDMSTKELTQWQAMTVL